ncbi:hypothetical protein G6F70_004438 [Rhizopus microsporus]|uniref:Uncharacterized protein n=1 Tax=Rhizopus azygosporus TaxID=86630 RepID=A0A367JR00_RHIAZ|nr:hypothetical protein G6F71_005959 [Rhizopus microsporus]RCH92358.1 hypothetical protein CU097_008002 [Rhizopus azygosporus]KAG1199981.1 hypothetical protein G6F70_004438 [Rhizopus microsporus]KAG1215760.1 hypothetical protein G6F69_000747 [Rhizopus microsporus]KAG1231930.1 hypothetical protein G6F67_005388 [Rhizopus microsporus]
MNNERLPRWKFRKQKKLEKRRKRRQEAASNRVEPESTVDREEYERQKAQWEANEVKYKIIETAKKKAREKEEEARKIAQKKWEQTLLSLPLIPSTTTTTTTTTKKEFSLKKKNNHNQILKTFVRSNQEEQIPKRKTYRERFLEQKERQTNA